MQAFPSLSAALMMLCCPQLFHSDRCASGSRLQSVQTRGMPKTRLKERRRVHSEGRNVYLHEICLPCSYGIAGYSIESIKPPGHQGKYDIDVGPSQPLGSSHLVSFDNFMQYYSQDAWTKTCLDCVLRQRHSQHVLDTHDRSDSN